MDRGKGTAAVEVDVTGHAIPKERHLIVFPGFDETKFGDILTTLTIASTDPKRSKLASVDSVSPESIKGLNDSRAEASP